MQSLNDDMDEELFRRAGEEYPLRTNGADWNKVMQGMRQAEEDSPEKNNKQNNYRYLFLLLLLPIGFVCGRYVGKDKRDNSVKTNSIKEIKNSRSTTGSADANKKADNRIALNKNAMVAQKNDDNNITLNKNGNSNDKPRVSYVRYSSRFSDDPKIERNNSTKKTAIENSTAAKESYGKTGDKVLANDKESLAAQGEIKNAKNEKAPENVLKLQGVANFKTTTSSGNDSAIEARGKLTQKDTVAKSLQQPATDLKTVDNKNYKQSKQPFKRKFYYSLILGPDISTIKLQRVNKVGYSLGLSLGYQITKKISIEAGALWDRKNYYTDGQNLDTSKLSLSRHLTVVNADGYCDMIEIPINAKFDFAAEKNHSWFVTAGVSTYLMQKEEYTINYKMYNTTGRRDYGYTSSTNNWFSIVNVSAGYQKNLGKSANIRFAPYIKIPVTGLGIGRLPIASTGIYITFSRSFH